MKTSRKNGISENLIRYESRREVVDEFDDGTTPAQLCKLISSVYIVDGDLSNSH